MLLSARLLIILPEPAANYGKKDCRLRGQRPCDCNTLLLAAGEVIRHAFQFILQCKHMNHVIQKIPVHGAPSGSTGKTIFSYTFKIGTRL